MNKKQYIDTERETLIKDVIMLAGRILLESGDVLSRVNYKRII